MSKKAFLLLSILLFVCHLSNAQTKVDWKQIKNTPHSFSGYGITEFDFPATTSITLGEVNATSGSIGNLTSTSVTTDSLSAGSIETNSIETETIEGTTGHFLNMDVDQSITAGMHVYVGSGDTRGDFSGEGLTTRVLTLNPVHNAPSMARVGSLYYNSDDHKIYINENGTWKPLAQEVRIELPSTIESDIITFDGKLNVTDGITTTEVTTTEINAHDITATGSVSITEDLSVGGDVSVTGDISNPNGKILTKEVMFTPSTTGIQAIKGAVYYNSTTNKLYVCTGFDSDDNPVWEPLNGSEITVDSTIIANSTNPVQSKVIQQYVDTKIADIPSGSSITVDSTLDTTSNNPVRNSAITQSLYSMVKLESTSSNGANYTLKLKNNDASTYTNVSESQKILLQPIYPSQIVWDSSHLKKRGDTKATQTSLTQLDGGSVVSGDSKYVDGNTVWTYLNDGNHSINIGNATIQNLSVTGTASGISGGGSSRLPTTQPTTPQKGDMYIDSNGVVWVYTGTEWVTLVRGGIHTSTSETHTYTGYYTQSHGSSNIPFYYTEIDTYNELGELTTSNITFTVQMIFTSQFVNSSINGILTQGEFINNTSKVFNVSAYFYNGSTSVNGDLGFDGSFGSSISLSSAAAQTISVSCSATVYYDTTD